MHADIHAIAGELVSMGCCGNACTVQPARHERVTYREREIYPVSRQGGVKGSRPREFVAQATLEGSAHLFIEQPE